jgi:hypothetical protein
LEELAQAAGRRGSPDYHAEKRRALSAQTLEGIVMREPDTYSPDIVPNVFHVSLFLFLLVKCEGGGHLALSVNQFFENV